MKQEPKENPDFWNSQLSGIDMSALPQGANITQKPNHDEVEIAPPLKPQKTIEEQADINYRNTLVVLATLAGALKEIKEAPGSMHSVMVICRLSTGSFRLMFPHEYPTEVLLDLASAAEYFSTLLDAREDT